MAIKQLNISKKADFLLATGSGIASVAQLFGRDPAEWEIDEGSYNNVPFHVFKTKVSWGGALPSIRDSGGRRLAQLSFPYRDGQTTDDLGRKAETFDVEAVLFGDTYIAGLKILMRELQKPDAGVLVHPVRGIVRAKMLNYTLTHEHQSRKAVLLSITFVEHAFTLASYGKIAETKNFKSILNDLLAGFQVINNLYNKVRAAVNLLNSVIAQVQTVIDSYNTAFGDTVVSLNSTFNTGGSFDLPALLPVNQGGVLLADGTLAQGIITSATVPNDPFRSVPIAQLQSAIAASQAQFGTAGITGASDFTTGDSGGQIAGVSTIGLSAETAANLAASLASIVTQNKVNSCRLLADELISTLERLQFGQPFLAADGSDSDGSLEYASEILDIRRMVNMLQDAYEAGVDQAQIGLKTYVVPRLMSLREIAFANGLDVERVVEIDLLNAELESTNYIAADSEVIVPL
jgi:hypothetical protein